MLCGSISSYSYERQHTDEEKIKKAISDIFSDGIATNNEAAKRILGILFPKTKVALEHSYSFGRYYDYRKFLIHCNIAVPECFDRYFSLSLGDDAIPTATMRNLIYEANESEVVTNITQLYQDGKIIRLLEEIEAYANKGDSKNIPAERATVLIRCLCRMWSSFEVEEKEFFTVPFAWRLLFCVDPLLKAVDTAERLSFLRGIFEDKMVEPSTLALLLQDFESQHGRCTDKGPNENKQAISLDELLELEPVFKSRCIDAIDSGTALLQYGGLNFLWMLSQIDEELAKHIKETLVTDDISLAKIISYCTSHGKAAIKLIINTRKVDKQALSEFIDINEAYQRIGIFVTTCEFLRLPTENQEDVIAFIITMKREENNSPTEGLVAEDAIKDELQKILNAIQLIEI